MRVIFLTMVLITSIFANSSEDKLIEFFEKHDIRLCFRSESIYSSCLSSEFFFKEHNMSDIYIIGSYGAKELEFPVEIELLTNLEKISFHSGATIKSFNNLEKLTNLKSLYLQISGMKEIPSDIFKIKSLEEIYISSDLTSIPDEIETLSNLKSLDLGWNQITNISEKVFNLKNLTYLDLSHNSIEYLSDDINNTSNLTYLDLSNNNVEYLNSNINNLSNLKTLKLSNNKITNFDVDLNLTTLDISNNNIKSINFENIFNMRDLEYLNLSNNNLDLNEKLPEMSNLVNLTNLYLSDTNILNIDVISNFTKLKNLSLNNNNIKDISIIGNLSNLENLDLSNNRIEKLPISINNLTKLKSLNLSFNNIKVIPKEIGEIHTAKETPPTNVLFWVKETSLYINDNKISIFPKEFCKLENFDYLLISNNFSTLLPECMKNVRTRYLSDTNGSMERVDNYLNVSVKFYTDSGWDFYKLQIGYSYLDDNETISFYPILGEDYNITSFSWDFGDGNISTLEKPIYEFSNYGDYNVSLTIITKDENITTSKIISHKERVLKIKKGWNFLTTPTKEDINISKFPNNFIFWSYNDENWTLNPNSIKLSVGFWINADREFNYYYDGENYSFQTFYIKYDWNLVGSGEKIVIDKNLTNWHYKDGIWFQSPIIDIGEGVWIKKELTSD